MGFQYEADAQAMLAVSERLAHFRLVFHRDKTRLPEFGKLVAERRRGRNAQRLGTFASLGFTHYCAWSRDGRFVVKRRTEGKRVTRKLHEVEAEMRRRMHTPVRAQHGWLSRVLRGTMPTTVCRASGCGWAASTRRSRAAGIECFAGGVSVVSRGRRSTRC